MGECPRGECAGRPGTGGPTPTLLTGKPCWLATVEVSVELGLVVRAKPDGPPLEALVEEYRNGWVPTAPKGLTGKYGLAEVAAAEAAERLKAYGSWPPPPDEATTGVVQLFWGR